MDAWKHDPFHLLSFWVKRPDFRGDLFWGGSIVGDHHTYFNCPYLVHPFEAITPPKTKIDTHNSYIYLKGGTSEKPSFLVPMLNLWWVLPGILPANYHFSGFFAAKLWVRINQIEWGVSNNPLKAPPSLFFAPLQQKTKIYTVHTYIMYIEDAGMLNIPVIYWVLYIPQAGAAPATITQLLQIISLQLLGDHFPRGG